MRFREVKKFRIEELILDESNYRFLGAANQKACIQKIFEASPQNFKNLMKSIAEDDLGELLLVYEHKGKNIVLDGNRRLAALKVLDDPKYAPNEAIKEYASKLLDEYKVDFRSIQAQVSSDKSLIYKTVYERHAAGNGKSRIGWSAYGASRFRYDQKIEDGREWYAIAMLLETENQHPELSEFIDSSDYSHEVFRRIFRSALENNIISKSIFSDKDQRIKKTADKKLLKDATIKTKSFLEAMRVRDISLSRGGNYADKTAVDDYVKSFAVSPDNERISDPKPKPQKPANGEDAPEPPEDTAEDQPDVSGGTSSESREKSQGYGIGKSEEILRKLEKLKSNKLLGLYTSLCTVSVKSHPQLMYVGAWSFFETICSLMDKKDGTSFPSFLDGQMNSLELSRQKKKEYSLPLTDISEKGNATKHSGTYFTATADQLINDFQVLEPFIIQILDRIISTKEKKAA